MLKKLRKENKEEVFWHRPMAVKKEEKEKNKMELVGIKGSRTTRTGEGYYKEDVDVKVEELKKKIKEGSFDKKLISEDSLLLNDADKIGFNNGLKFALKEIDEVFGK